MNLTTPNISFKGYDACPIKNIYVKDYGFEPFYEEIEEVTDKEQIGLIGVYDYSKWMQDNKTIIKKNSIPILLNNGEVLDITKKMFQNRGIDSFVHSGFITGGNCFIGKNNEERWILVGEDDCPDEEHKKLIANAYEADIKNVFVIPQQEYHLDMFLRPIGYPYILVNDYELAIENLKKIDGNPEKIKKLAAFLKLLSRNPKTNCDNTIKALENAGFKPIRIAGDYQNGINFMNAIVNQHKDGTISYITNSSKTRKSKLSSNIQDVFEQELKQKVPNIDKIYFIRGKNINPIDGDNLIKQYLKYQKGGLHCLCLEKPNFDVWG